MPDEQDQPGITGPSYPPPQPPPPNSTPLAAIGLALELAAALALVAGRADLALWVAIGGLIVTIFLLILLMRAQDQPGIVGPLPPPPPRKPVALVNVVLALGTVVALLGDRADVATALAVLAVAAGGVTLGLMVGGAKR
jgi:hypothetical protein